MNNQEKRQTVLSRFLQEQSKKLKNYVNSFFTGGFFAVDAEDIIQDVALNIFTKLDFDAPIENIASYFYRAIRNKIIDNQRRKNPNISIENYTNDEGENLLLNGLVIEDDQISPSEKEENYQKLMEAITKLKPDQQAIVMETEFEGYTFAELSERWNIPIGTLLARKHRALKQLYDILTMEK
ncbi:MAG: sigma-70 family RNA polymerase sigma factor [Salinivirgaceae bacterium]|nr:sigma-70 family RNA polymerase sigma factor [Salinivirgaceae bacterium]